MLSPIQLFQWLVTVALFVNAVSYIPQIRRIRMTKSSKDLSLTTYGIWLIIIFIQAIYMILRQDFLYAIGISFNLVMCLMTGLIALHYRPGKIGRL